VNNVEIRFRIEAGLKKDAENIFQSIGMTMSEAIRIFLVQSVNSDGLPFRPCLRKPNKTTIESFSEVKTGNFVELAREEFGKYLKELDDETN
jgi:DNA-damage-inducible protein J